MAIESPLVPVILTTGQARRCLEALNTWGDFTNPTIIKAAEVLRAALRVVGDDYRIEVRFTKRQMREIRRLLKGWGSQMQGTRRRARYKLREALRAAESV